MGPSHAKSLDLIEHYFTIDVSCTWKLFRSECSKSSAQKHALKWKTHLHLLCYTRVKAKYCGCRSCHLWDVSVIWSQRPWRRDLETCYIFAYSIKLPMKMIRIIDTETYTRSPPPGGSWHYVHLSLYTLWPPSLKDWIIKADPESVQLFGTSPKNNKYNSGNSPTFSRKQSPSGAIKKNKKEAIAPYMFPHTNHDLQFTVYF